jgi:4-hydroxyphenylacetate 3-monooxygenase
MSQVALPKTIRSDANGLRTGAEFLRSLDDGRQIFLEGERVSKVLEQPAFCGAARSIAKLFDIAAAPEMRERMTFPSPKSGAPVWRVWQIPRSHAERGRRSAVVGGPLGADQEVGWSVRPRTGPPT